MRFETTVRRPVEASGTGLHSGVPVNIRILPAPPATGIVFFRTDLERFPIPASWRHVTRVSYATSLMRQGVLISTTEHLLSVFYSMGVDNAYVEIDNLEVPILDGSGLPFVELIARAGLKQSRRVRRYLRIRRPVSIEDGSRRITILPADSFQLTCDVFFDHPLVGRQVLELEVTPERYASEIAPARTFGFDQELDRMRDMGLIRGASLDNAVCFNGQGVLNPAGLRFSDECCRHKALDLI
ncbi:MAG: UDP-3-O-acyl-N-acetylglucosamine deacetylase, partial [Acidobacteria bacterium]|nr:UDP-3-O-acyl-N-acetylglucosamine deacetylase [Acidobacteriota bacterium]